MFWNKALYHLLTHGKLYEAIMLGQTVGFKTRTTATKWAPTQSNFFRNLQSNRGKKKKNSERNC